MYLVEGQSPTTRLVKPREGDREDRKETEEALLLVNTWNTRNQGGVKDPTKVPKGV